MVLKTLVKFASKRIPLIKFRSQKGLPGQKSPGSTPAAAPSASSTKPSSAYSRGPAIEDWELPPRYARKPITAIEMEYINRGGPA